MINYEKARLEMSPRDITNLEDILKKDNNSLTEYERNLLTARQDYLTDEAIDKYSINISGNVEVAGTGGKYDGRPYAELRKEAIGRGIIIERTTKLPEIISLLEQYDNLKEGDEFQGKITYVATEEMIAENGLEDQLQPGDLYFVDKDAIQEEEKEE